MAKRMHAPVGFLPDGHQRAREAMEPSIRSTVESEFAGQLKEASLWQRWRIRMAINREIDRRIAERAPPTAFY